MTVDTGITITLTAEETAALCQATAFYMEYVAKVGFNHERINAMSGIYSLILKMGPHLQRKAEEERNA